MSEFLPIAISLGLLPWLSGRFSRFRDSPDIEVAPFVFPCIVPSEAETGGLDGLAAADLVPKDFAVSLITFTLPEAMSSLFARDGTVSIATDAD